MGRAMTLQGKYLDTFSDQELQQRIEGETASADDAVRRGDPASLRMYEVHRFELAGLIREQKRRKKRS
jgi:hypothetical protein